MSTIQPSVLTGTLILGEEVTPRQVRAHDYDSPITGPITIAALEVAGLTIQSQYPGALRVLAAALIDAEDQADALRAARSAVAS